MFELSSHYILCLRVIDNPVVFEIMLHLCLNTFLSVPIAKVALSISAAEREAASTEKREGTLCYFRCRRLSPSPSSSDLCITVSWYHKSHDLLFM